MVAMKKAGQKAKVIAKQKAKRAATELKAEVPLEENKEAAASSSRPEVANKAPPAAEKAEPEAKAKSKPRKTKARRLEEAQARIDAEEKGEEGPATQTLVDSAEPRGVIYVGHIPPGFYEPQMKKYFSQFGKVTRLRHSRSKKAGKSRGYAWVEFAEEAVAKIAQQTMNGYLLFGRKLVCEMVPKEKQHRTLFKNWNKKFVNFTNSRRKKAREVHNNRPSADVDGEQIPLTSTKVASRLKKTQGRLKRKLEALEVDFDMDAFKVEVGKAAPGSPAAGLLKAKKQQEASASPKVAVPVSPKVDAEAAPAAAEAGKKKRRKA